MQLEGKAICHIQFGTGIVKELREKYITVVFAQEEKKFLFPDAFLKFLVLKDKKMQQKVNQVLQGILSKKQKEKEEELREKEHLERVQKVKIKPNSQAAFGLVQNEKEDVFESWTVFAGKYVTGKSEGQPKPPVRMKLNSVCLLTECAKDEPEKQRRIIGAFMVKDDFEGSSCRDGIIKSHHKFKIKLEEDEMLPFWDYFPSDVEVPTKWGRSEIRYFSTEKMECILNDIKNVIFDRERHQIISDFYEYFCSVNRLKNVQESEVE
jgi:hypothetical protein